MFLNDRKIELEAQLRREAEELEKRKREEEEASRKLLVMLFIILNSDKQSNIVGQTFETSCSQAKNV